MKTLNIIVLLLALTSVQVLADDKVKNKRLAKLNNQLALLTDQSIEVPRGLAFIKAKNALVPVAPLQWNEPEGEITIKRVVPLAPRVTGDPDAAAPLGLMVKKANAGVPVAPFTFGSADEFEAPQLASR